MQELKLKIRRVSVLTGRGPDHISIYVPNDEVLDKVLGSTEARAFFPELYFELRISAGKGEELAEALGLEVDEVIRT